MSDRIEALEVELEMERAAAEFRSAKAAAEKKDTPANRRDYRAAKEKLRQARHRFRTEFRTAPSGDGDASVAPDPVKTKGEVS